jgi:hypothetical protein
MSAAPAHSVVVPVHMNEHMPLAQTWSRPHAMPHAPQWAVLVWSDTHRSAPPSPPPQSISPVAHSGTHALF